MHRLPGSQIIPYDGTTPKFGKNCFMASGACAIGDLETGDDVSFWFQTVVRADCHYIRIGHRVNIQDAAVVHVTNKRFATFIEDEVSIGHSAVIHGCTIRKGSLIGMGAILMDGVEVGESSLVAAGALLPPGKLYPSCSLIKGYPAKADRSLTEDELAMVANTHINYMGYKKKYQH
jgi:carbonic anhydrase/acetyltransferase-like protein (isoleucine patch superfamily)